MSDILVIGELNPYGFDPAYALYHLPRRASGNRLREHLGLSDVEYLKLRKMNLCYGKWSMVEARKTVAHIKANNPRTDLVILLGAKVRDAFDLKQLKFFEAYPACPSIALLPHPSGLNRTWNEPGARSRARDLLRSLCPEIPWGESSD